MTMEQGTEVLARFNGYWYPGVVVGFTPTRVVVKFATRNGTKEYVRKLRRDYVRLRSEGEPGAVHGAKKGGRV
jgi:hypothetical protein